MHTLVRAGACVCNTKKNWHGGTWRKWTHHPEPLSSCIIHKPRMKPDQRETAPTWAHFQQQATCMTGLLRYLSTSQAGYLIGDVNVNARPMPMTCVWRPQPRRRCEICWTHVRLSKTGLDSGSTRGSVAHFVW